MDKYLQNLIDRIARLSAAQVWHGALNPTQFAVLNYLSRANRFSRSPSHVAQFMTATRGTISQTLKSLARKGLTREMRSPTDKRWISYDITKDGVALLAQNPQSDEVHPQLTDDQVKTLTMHLELLLKNMLHEHSHKSFGLCKSCKYHESRAQGGYCKLLDKALKPAEADQICHEHV